MATNSFGELLRLTTFGESHGPAIGGVLDGYPAGVIIDTLFVQSEMLRRRPGQSAYTTTRDEEDEVQFLSGIFEGKSTGAPIAFVIANKDQRSQDYAALSDVYRPGHADEVYDKKYGLRDHRGGGRSSARETAVRVAAGALCKLLLKSKSIDILAYVQSIGSITASIHPLDVHRSAVESNPVRCPDSNQAHEMMTAIDRIREEKDSLGGCIQCVVRQMPIGLGDPMYQKLHARLAFAMMSINAVQGFEMHRGFERTTWKGTENNRFKTGISAGISTGDPLLFSVAFKPTSTIGQAQTTINKAGETVQLEASGRHDPCVVPRAVAIVEAMTALVLADAWLMNKSQILCE
jgi:chorismate synthase